MHVIKRDGTSQEVRFDKITARVKALCSGLNERYIDAVRMALLCSIDSNRKRANAPTLSTPPLSCAVPSAWLSR